jgi:ABC-type branched-subunit amino acid transport system permease subunit
MTQYVTSFLEVGVVFMFFTIALNIRWGWAGDLDLSVFSYIAVGAYITAVFVAGKPTPPDEWIIGLRWPFLVALIASMIAGGVLSLLFGMLALRRLRGDYFAIGSLCFTLIVYAIVSQFLPLFDSFQGVTGVPQPFEGTLKLSQNAYDVFYLVFSIAVLGVVYAFTQHIYRSPFGRSLRAIRDDPEAALAFGRNVYVSKLKAYVIGGMLASLGGGLYVGILGTWNPFAWSSSETFLLLCAVLIGGIANTKGVLLGTFIVMVALTEATRYIPALPGPSGQDDSEAIQYIIVSLLIMAVLRWRPQGILPEKRDLDGVTQSRNLRWRPQGTLAENRDRDSLAESGKQ